MQLPPEPLDFVLIDGGHGFPTPMLDWFYGAGRLRRGGVAVFDDVQLPAVAMLVGTWPAAFAGTDLDPVMTQRQMAFAHPFVSEFKKLVYQALRR